MVIVIPDSVAASLEAVVCGCVVVSGGGGGFVSLLESGGLGGLGIP